MSEKAPQPKSAEDTGEHKKAPKRSKGRVAKAVAMLALTAASMGVGGKVAGAQEAPKTQPQATTQETRTPTTHPDAQEVLKQAETARKEREKQHEYQKQADEIRDQLKTEGSEFDIFFGSVQVLDTKKSPLLTAPNEKATPYEDYLEEELSTSHEIEVDYITFENPIIVEGSDGHKYFGSHLDLDDDTGDAMVFTRVHKGAAGDSTGDRYGQIFYNGGIYEDRHEWHYTTAEVKEISEIRDYDGDDKYDPSWVARASIPEDMDIYGYTSTRVIAEIDSNIGIRRGTEKPKPAITVNPNTETLPTVPPRNTSAPPPPPSGSIEGLPSGG